MVGLKDLSYFDKLFAQFDGEFLNLNQNILQKTSLGSLEANSERTPTTLVDSLNAVFKRKSRKQNMTYFLYFFFYI